MAATLSQHYPENFQSTLQTWSSSNLPSHHHHYHLRHYLSSSSSSSSSTLMKTTKTLIQTLIYTQFLRRLHRALAKAKSFFSSFISQATHAKNKYEHKLRLGSFRLHYNWTSSSFSRVPAARSYAAADELSGYLQWLEDNINKKEVVLDDDDDDKQERFYSARHDDDDDDDEEEEEDIDKLAELFIANCHDKFLLEKQESYRRFQDMLARSL